MLQIRPPVLTGLMALGAVAAFAGPAAAACVGGAPAIIGDACYNVFVPGASASDDKPISLSTPVGLGNVQAYAEANNNHGGTAIAEVATGGDDVIARASINWLIAPTLNPGFMGDELIPLRVIAEASWTFTGDPGGGSAGFTMTQGGSTLYNGTFNAFVVRSDIFSLNEVFWVRPDQAINVFIQASASSRQGFTSSSRVVVDPIFEIVGDYAERYTLQGLLGDTPTIPPGGGAVPEPSAWVLLIAGFGLMGSAVRRRRVAPA